MPDLGPYAVPVLAAYAASIGLILVLVAASLWQAGRMRRRLAETEARAEEAAR
jgi:heme exporter protein D